ncbi:unnamed protein product [Lampetra fluviatilis]
MEKRPPGTARTNQRNRKPNASRRSRWGGCGGGVVTCLVLTGALVLSVVLAYTLGLTDTVAGTDMHARALAVANIDTHTPSNKEPTKRLCFKISEKLTDYDMDGDRDFDVEDVKKIFQDKLDWDGDGDVDGEDMHTLLAGVWTCLSCRTSCSPCLAAL